MQPRSLRLQGNLELARLRSISPVRCPTSGTLRLTACSWLKWFTRRESVWLLSNCSRDPASTQPMRTFAPQARSALRCRAPVQHRMTKANFFKFGKNGADSKEAGIYGNMERDDFDRVEMEQYFNYTGRLAVEKTYDSFDAYLERGTHPVDVILLWASEEGDAPKVEEVLAAGADVNVKDLNGKTASDLSASEEVTKLLEEAAAKV